MLKRRLQGTVISMTLIALLSACGQAKAPAPMPSDQPKSQSSPSPAPAVNPDKQLGIKTYYGDELGDKLVEKDATISFKQDHEKYAAALQALTASSDPKLIPLLKGFTIRSAVLKDQMLTVDVSMSPESRLGSGGEALLLQALKKTIFQFSEIQSFDLLLDGKAVDSLMGHMDLPHPITKG